MPDPFRPVLLVRGFDPMDESPSNPYYGFNDGTVYPHRLGDAPAHRRTARMARRPRAPRPAGGRPLPSASCASATRTTATACSSRRAPP